MNLDELQRDFQSRGIVCPMPRPWSKLHAILLDGNLANLEIPNPLILGGWGMSDAAKSKRFSTHLKIAQKLGLLSQVINYLDRLDEDDFLYSKDLMLGRTLSPVGYYDLLEEDIAERAAIFRDALETLEQIQLVDQTIADEDALNNLFVTHQFFPYNDPKVERGQSDLIDLLIDLADAFDRVRALKTIASSNLEEFCFDLFEFEKRSED